MTLTKIQRGNYKYGFAPLTDFDGTCSLPVGSGIAVTRGDLVTFSSGYLALCTSLGLANTPPDVYVALSTNTAAEASSNGAVNCSCIPIMMPGVRYAVPVGANAVLVQATHVGNAYNLSGVTTGAFSITVASAVTVDWGFMIEEIDITTEAIAFCTYGMAIGRFVQFSETT